MNKKPPIAASRDHNHKFASPLLSRDRLTLTNVFLRFWSASSCSVSLYLSQLFNILVQVEDLYCLAIVHKHGIKSLRELKSSHLPLLHTILTEGKEAISQKFGLPHSKIRLVGTL